MKIGWTLNVVIMEAELTKDVRRWYLKQAREQQWSKTILLESWHPRRIWKKRSTRKRIPAILMTKILRLA